MAETGDHLCSRNLSDNDSELKSELDSFLKMTEIKHSHTAKYAPEPLIESKKNQLRKITRQVFVSLVNIFGWNTDSKKYTTE